MSIALLGRKIGQRVVAPIIHQPAFHKLSVVDKGMDREQFKRSDAQTFEMIDNWRRRQPAKLAAPCRRYVLAKLRQSLDVRFVDDRVFPGDQRPMVFTPGE